MSNEPDLCVLTGAYCSTKDCPLYHHDTLQCKFIMAIENILGGFTPAKEKASTPLQPRRLKPFPKLEGQWLKEIEGEVVTPLETREVDTSSGITAITNFELTDGKKKIRVGVWGELGTDLRLRPGDIVKLLNMKIGQPYEGMEQISSTRRTEIK